MHNIDIKKDKRIQIINFVGIPRNKRQRHSKLHIEGIKFPDYPAR